MKKIAVINDLSGFGKCSLTAAIPIVSALGVQCCPLVTGVFSNQTGYDSYHVRDLTDDMMPCVEQWKKLGVSFDGILTGFIANSRQGQIICDMIDSFRTEKTRVIVDPVMGDDGSVYKSHDSECIAAVKGLVKKADIITPNITELCILCGADYEAVVCLQEDSLLAKIKELCDGLCASREMTVITTGIRTNCKTVANAVYQSGKMSAVKAPLTGGSFSGTGDIFSSFVAAQCVKGVAVQDAVKQATNFISKVIEETVRKADESYRTADGICFEKYIHTLGDV